MYKIIERKMSIETKNNIPEMPNEETPTLHPAKKVSKQSSPSKPNISFQSKNSLSRIEMDSRTDLNERTRRKSRLPSLGSLNSFGNKTKQSFAGNHNEKAGQDAKNSPANQKGSIEPYFIPHPSSPNMFTIRKSQESMMNTTKGSFLATPSNTFKGTKFDFRINTPASKLDPDATQNSQQPAHDPQAFYDYNSGTTRFLMYIPDELKSLSTTSRKKHFFNFNEASKLKNSQSGQLDSIMRSSYVTQSANVTMDKVNSSMGRRTMSEMGLIQQQLSYNQKQKQKYHNIVKEELAQAYKPLIEESIQREKQKFQVFSNKHKIKVFPPRRRYQGPTSIQQLLEANQDIVLESHVRDTEGSPTPLEDGSGIFDKKLEQTDRIKDASSTTNVLQLPHKKEKRRDAVVFTKPQIDYTDSANFVYKFFWYQKEEVSHWKPQSREGHTINSIGRFLILYGGISNDLLEEISMFDRASNMWIKPDMMGETPPAGRHGHTAVEYNRCLYIVGGEQKFNTSLNFRECLNDIRKFDPSNRQWTLIKSHGGIIEPRRNHAVAVKDKAMVLYGGINNEGIYLNDVWVLNLKTFRWSQFDFENPFDLGIAFHSMCAVFTPKSFSYKIEKNTRKIQTEGFYCFGGQDSDGRILNTLKIFQFDSKKHEWVFPETHGQPPVARYGHTMTFCSQLCAIVVYGGRNDAIENNEHQNMCLNDIKIMSLDNFTWCTTSTHGYIPKMGRYSHAACLIDDQLFVFGGVSLTSYCDNNIYKIELGQSTARKAIKDYKSKSKEEPKKMILKTLQAASPINKNIEKKISFDPRPKNFISFQPIPDKEDDEESKRQMSEFLKTDQKKVNMIKSVIEKITKKRFDVRKISLFDVAPIRSEINSKDDLE